ncbi:crotonase/enoyl-CoA hydratase family protein [Polyangium aurulentum]|uniref:crotonase/enoyl-CoA hydratase family protein n=1 Tax=Polyangium aurulentum TaxID=2567896 RepID=UPI0010AEB2CC|nr:crotonase/enoyl-CoA hydratase family protein [Polyangium aurulentum]UQA58474.1 crotonase/enoyl-CoA hydratase family protein [Polyangium aurulentum]
MNDLVSLEIADAIATVTLTKPTMPPQFFAEIEEVFRGLSKDVRVRAVVVRSAAKGFSYGLDLPAAMTELGPHFAGGTAGARMELLGLIRRYQGAFDAVAACPVPVVAAVHGMCIGGGLDLAAACDIRLASRDAVFSLRETRIAIVADLGSLQRLPRIIGQGHLREMAFTGKDIGAERAAAIGLVNEVFDDAAAVHAGARRLAEEIARNAPLTVRGVKAVLEFGEGKTAADGLAYVAAWNAAFLASEDLGEAMAAFMEKRAPRFSGR